LRPECLYGAARNNIPHNLRLQPRRIWLFGNPVTGLAVQFTLRGDAITHRRWMIRSYALTAAAITLRIYLPLSFVFHVPFSIGYPAIAWLCWIPNLRAVEVYLRLVPTPSRITLVLTTRTRLPID